MKRSVSSSRILDRSISKTKKGSASSTNIVKKKKERSKKKSNDDSSGGDGILTKSDSNIPEHITGTATIEDRRTIDGRKSKKKKKRGGSSIFKRSPSFQSNLSHSSPKDNVSKKSETRVVAKSSPATSTTGVSFESKTNSSKTNSSKTNSSKKSKRHSQKIKTKPDSTSGEKKKSKLKRTASSKFSLRSKKKSVLPSAQSIFGLSSPDQTDSSTAKRPRSNSESKNTQNASDQNTDQANISYGTTNELVFHLLGTIERSKYVSNVRSAIVGLRHVDEFEDVLSFLVSLPHISSPNTILHLLTDRYRLSSFDSSTQEVKQNAVLLFLSLWLEHYYDRDFQSDGESIAQLAKLVALFEKNGEQAVHYFAKFISDRTRIKRAESVPTALAKGGNSAAGVPAAPSSMPDSRSSDNTNSPDSRIPVRATRSASSTTARSSGEIAARKLTEITNKLQNNNNNTHSRSKSAEKVPEIVSIPQTQAQQTSPPPPPQDSFSMLGAVSLPSGSVKNALRTSGGIDLSSDDGNSSAIQFHRKIQSSKTNANPFGIHLSPEEAAHYITLVDLAAFKSVQESELLELGLPKLKKDREESNTNTRGMPTFGGLIDRFNHISFWTANAILKAETASERGKFMSAFVALANKLYKLNNFHSLLGVLAGLNLSSIARLKAGWAEVPVKLRSTLEHIEKKVSAQNNYKVYRDKLSKIVSLKQDCIPYLGVFLRDLTFIQDGNNTYQAGTDDRINMQKIRLVSQNIKLFKNCQNSSYKNLKEKNIRTLAYFSTFEDLIENPQKLHELSLIREPRAASSHVSSSSKTDKSSSSSKTDNPPPISPRTDNPPPLSPRQNSSNVSSPKNSPRGEFAPNKFISELKKNVSRTKQPYESAQQKRRQQATSKKSAHKKPPVVPRRNFAPVSYRPKSVMINQIASDGMFSPALMEDVALGEQQLQEESNGPENGENGDQGLTDLDPSKLTRYELEIAFRKLQKMNIQLSEQVQDLIDLNSDRDD